MTTKRRSSMMMTISTVTISMMKNSTVKIQTVRNSTATQVFPPNRSEPLKGPLDFEAENRSPENHRGP